MINEKDNGKLLAKRYSRRVKLFDDETLSKRVFTYIERGSKSTYNYRAKVKQGQITPSAKNSKEVMVKITGSSKNNEALSAHIDYISRKGELELNLDGDELYKGKEDNEIVKDSFTEFGTPINYAKDIKGTEKREAMHIVFSMKDHETTPPDKLLKAVIKTVKERYPNNTSAFAYHGDTDNPHVHTVLKVADAQGKRIDIRKKDLAELRISFAKELNELGIEAYATINRNYDKAERKNHHYKVVDYGHAKYKFSTDEKAQDSYYVKYETKSGIVDIWSKDLEKVVKENNVKKGDFARFKIVGKEPVTIEVKKKENGKTVIYKKETHRSIWDCSIQGKNEKELKDPAKNKKKTKFTLERLKSKLAEFRKSQKKPTQTRDKDKDKKRFKSKTRDRTKDKGFER